MVQGIWIVVGVVGLLVGAGVTMMRGTQRRGDAWSEVARALGLEFVAYGASGGPELTGEIDGVSVRVHMERARRPRPKRADDVIYFICVRAQLDTDLPLGMQIYNRDFFQRADGEASARDIRVGDEELDAKFVFRGDSPDAISQRVRGAHARRALLDGLRVARSLRVEGSVVQLREQSQGANASELRRYVEVCAVLARALSGRVEAG